MIRPMAANVSALSSVVANGHPASHFVSATPSDPAVRRVFPSTVGSQPRRSVPFRSRSRRRLTRYLRSFPCLGLGPDVSVRGCAHRPLAQRGLSCPRRQTLLRPDAPVGRAPSSLGLLGLLRPVFALAGRSPHLPFFGCSLRPSLPQPGSPPTGVCYHYSAQPSIAEAGLAPASMSQFEGCT